MSKSGKDSRDYEQRLHRVEGNKKKAIKNTLRNIPTDPKDLNEEDLEDLYYETEQDGKWKR